jgi:uncharacterized protein DUF3618
MGERPDQIEREIVETRNQLTDNVGALERKVKDAVDWRTQFQQRPGTLLAMAFGGGALLCALLPSPRRSRRSRGSDSTSASQRNYPTPSYQPSSAPPAKSSDLRGTVEALGSALLGAAVNQASGFFDSLLPGFHQEFTKARSNRDNFRSNDQRRDSHRDTRSDDSPISTYPSALGSDTAKPKAAAATA